VLHIYVLKLSDSSIGGYSRPLVVNSAWRQPLSPDNFVLPDGFEITTDRTRLAEARVVVFHIPDIGRIDTLAKRAGQIWVAWSMECEVNYPCLRDPQFMQRFDWTMGYHLDADIPTFYCSSEHLELLKTPAQPRPPGNLAVMLVSSHFNHSRRLQYLQELMNYLPIHSYGKVLNNRRLENDTGRLSKMTLIAQYPFTLAFENAVAPDYVTEKFFDPLIAGSLPVYLGASNIADFAPGEHCYINALDFENPAALAAFLLELASDEQRYLSYLAWKSRPLRPQFVELVELTREPAFARLCRRMKP